MEDSPPEKPLKKVAKVKKKKGKNHMAGAALPPLRGVQTETKSEEKTLETDLSERDQLLEDSEPAPRTPIRVPRRKPGYKPLNQFEEDDIQGVESPDALERQIKASAPETPGNRREIFLERGNLAESLSKYDEPQMDSPRSTTKDDLNQKAKQAEIQDKKDILDIKPRKKMAKKKLHEEKENASVKLDDSNQGSGTGLFQSQDKQDTDSDVARKARVKRKQREFSKKDFRDGEDLEEQERKGHGKQKQSKTLQDVNEMKGNASVISTESLTRVKEQRQLRRMAERQTLRFRMSCVLASLLRYRVRHPPPEIKCTALEEVCVLSIYSIEYTFFFVTSNQSLQYSSSSSLY